MSRWGTIAQESGGSAYSSPFSTPSLKLYKDWQRAETAKDPPPLERPNLARPRGGHPLQMYTLLLYTPSNLSVRCQGFEDIQVKWKIWSAIQIFLSSAEILKSPVIVVSGDNRRDIKSLAAIESWQLNVRPIEDMQQRQRVGVSAHLFRFEIILRPHV